MLSNKDMRWLLSLRNDFISGMCGFRWRSTSCDIFSVGPSQPLTIGLTAIGLLCIFFRKYSCWVLGGGLVSSVRYFLVIWSIIPSFCIVSV